MTKTFTFHVDAGHAWLEVTYADMQEVGLEPVDFSRYSHMDHRGNYYLEEDCDASRFIAAYQRKHGSEPAFLETPEWPCPGHISHVRALPRLGEVRRVAGALIDAIVNR